MVTKKVENGHTKTGQTLNQKLLQKTKKYILEYFVCLFTKGPLAKKIYQV